MICGSRRAVVVPALLALSFSVIADSSYDRGIERDRLTETLDLPQQVAEAQQAVSDEKAIHQLCSRIGSKLGSVSIKQCLAADLAVSGGVSTNGLAIGMKEYPPIEGRRAPLGRVLLLGGIHGDEFSAVSVIFKWMQTLDKHHSGLFHWHVVPTANPDGLLQARSQRMNANGVDLNRNFPTNNWDVEASRYWAWTGRAKRRFPGKVAASESETQWIISEIERFKPDVIVQVHAPYGLVDFDGPDQPPKKLGRLYLNLLGTFPGSLGNFGATVSGIPVVTIELPSAGSLPSDRDVSRVWTDLVGWLRASLPRQSKSGPILSEADEATQAQAAKH